MTAGQGHEIHKFYDFRCLTGSSLCSLLLQNYSTELSNADTNLQREKKYVDLHHIPYISVY